MIRRTYGQGNKDNISADDSAGSHYQFYREVLFALEKGGTFILLSYDRSPTFSTGHLIQRGKEYEDA